MARLIDADQFEVLSWDATGDTSYDQGFDDGVKLIAEKIDAAPTIDAIPVEWLNRYKTEYLDDWGENPVTVEQALKIWHKEQEAQDVGPQATHD